MTKELRVQEPFHSEMADVLMYFISILLRYYVTPEIISEGLPK